MTGSMTPNDMQIVVTREPSTPNGTLGRLEIYVKGARVYNCWTLEDPVRIGGKKVWGDTAIPEGKYEVGIRFSNRFQKRLPSVAGVENFQGVLIHGGNDKQDTHGCILVGTQLQALQPNPRIGICAPAVSKILEYLDANGAKATLTVKSR